MRAPAANARRGGRAARCSALLGLGLAAGLLASLATRPAAGTGSAAGSAPTVITVHAGAPSALSFALSKSSGLRPGIFVFEVTSRGKGLHSFELCTLPVAKATADSCAGVATKPLKSGQSATLTVTLVEPGRYEYLSTVPGQAAAGMKGLIAVGESVGGAAAPVATGPPSTAPTTTVCHGRCSPPATTTPAVKPPAVETLIGEAAVGQALFASNCGSCHALAAAGTTSSTGPNLDEYAPGQSLIVSYVTYGSDAMPAYGGVLTETQIDGIAAFVYRSTHASAAG
jgi:mono/diheme cytochrome c family protein